MTKTKLLAFAYSCALLVLSPGCVWSNRGPSKVASGNLVVSAQDPSFLMNASNTRVSVSYPDFLSRSPSYGTTVQQWPARIGISKIYIEQGLIFYIAAFDSVDGRNVSRGSVSFSPPYTWKQLERFTQKDPLAFDVEAFRRGVAEEATLLIWWEPGGTD